MPSGGPRQGTPGKAYPNRTDMQMPKVVPGQQYGQAAMQAQAQQMMPMAAPAAVPPGSLPPLAGPTRRPNEPVTAGLPSGPGPGPEALGAVPQGEGIRRLMPVLELLASQPDADPAAVNFVRRLRGALR
jgi:hypothetical protein